MATYALTWDLDSVFARPDTAAFQQALSDFHRDLSALAERSDRLPVIAETDQSAKDWSAFLAEYERIEALAGDLGSFIGCHAAADAANKLIRQHEATLSAWDPLRERIATNVEFALQAVPADLLARWLKRDAQLDRNQFFFEQRRKNAQMRLPREQELLAADLAVDGQHAWGRLYDRLSSELRITVMERGELVEKSPGQIRLDVPERSVRENNFYAANKAWHTIADSCADALNHLSGTRLTVYRRLGLADHLDMPLHRNRMTRQTLDTMWQVISRRKAMLLPYLAKKAQLWGLDKLAWYDTMAPLPPAVTEGHSSEIPYDQGCDLVVSAFDSFSPDLGDFARHSFNSRWVEAENRAGKRQGAFCTDLPGRKQTRVFMTYLNTQNNVSTLAHELGHAYHTWVLRNEPLFLQGYPMNLAETASTFAEAVLADKQLRTSRSRADQLQILDHQLSDAVAFLMNIHARFIFEHNFHLERPKGELTAARFSELMLAAQKEAYLDALDPDGWYPEFWISKLHFYISGWPFYNFPYTFGYLLSTGLFALAGDRPAEFPEQYRQLLIRTGCQETEEAVQSAFGIDLRQPEFWERSLSVIESRVQRFVELVDQRS